MALYLPEEEGAAWGWGTQGICCDGQKPGDLRTFALERTNLVMPPSQRGMSTHPQPQNIPE